MNAVTSVIPSDRPSISKAASSNPWPRPSRRSLSAPSWPTARAARRARAAG